MKFIDRFLQNWRTSIAIAHIAPGSNVLDIGCFDAVLFEKLGSKLKHGVGIDPLISPVKTEKYELVPGLFPQDLKSTQQFHAITMLAVLEHIPESEIPGLAKECYNYLLPGGKLIITVPDTKVDHILSVLKFLRLIDGMSLEEHHGFDIRKTPEFFSKAGFKLKEHSAFQLGLNNLFVFEKP